MKKTNLLCAAFLIMGMLFGMQVMAQGRIDLNGAKSAQACTTVNDEGFSATFSFGSIEAVEVSTEKGVFSNITMDYTYPAGNLGEPTLPVANKLLYVPYGATDLTVKVKGYSTEVYNLSEYGIHQLFPMQQPLRKDQKPEDIPFAYSEKAYNAKGFVEHPIAEVKIQGTMRGIQIGTLTVNPIQYDAASNTIRVFNNIEIEVSYGQYDKVASYNEFARTFSPYFAKMYDQMFNWRDDVYDEHPDLWNTPVKMLVIADRMFEDCMQDWINWKTTKGFYMDVNYTDQIGNNASAIRSFIQGKYAEDAPTFVMIMGDKNQVAPSANSGSETNCVTDLYYMTMDNDEFPEIYHSRFPAENVQQMQNMLEKALEYEQYTMPDPSYLSNVLLIAGEDSGWGVTVGRPTIWYATNYYYNEDHGFNNVYEYSHGTYTGCYANLNTGVGFANYTAHGSNTSWSGPQFTVSDVENLTNEHKYFLAMGNCCQAADWGISSTCFGEAMVRSEKKAAYAYIGSCPSTYWLNDYYFGVGATGRADGTMPTMEETTMGFYDAMWNDDAYNTVTSMMFIGNLAGNAADALGYTLHISTLYCWQAYHTLGDGSILPYRVQPTENEVSHMAIFPIGMSTYEVNAAPGSYVAVSMNGELHGVGMVDETGTINLEVEPVTTNGEVILCVTHPQHIPYIEEIPAAALEGAYVSVFEFTPANVHVGDENTMSITFKNVGTTATGGSTEVVLSCDDDRLTFTNNSASFESLDPEATVELEGFTYQIAEGTPDGTKFTIHTTATCGSDVWEGKAVITASEAVLAFAGMGSAGGFVPGENVTVTANFNNIGHYMATNAIATIACDNQYVTILNEEVELGTIDPEGTGIAVFEIAVDASCPETEVIDLSFTVNADGGLVAEGQGSVKNSCNIVFDLHDSYGDGWNGASLVVAFNDGTPSQSLSIPSGSSGSTYVIEVGNGVHVTLTWVSGSWDTEVSFEVSYENGDVIYSQGPSPTSGLLYEFDCNCGSAAIGTNDPVENLAYSVNDHEIILSWDGNDDAIGYTIYCNGVLLGSTTETTFTDEIVTEITFTYCVVAEYTDGSSLPECIIVQDALNVNEQNANITIFPNPAKNVLYINSNAEYSYEMYNGMGQQVTSGTAQGTQKIDVNGLAKGVYFLRLTTGDQVEVRKVMVD